MAEEELAEGDEEICGSGPEAGSATKAVKLLLTQPSTVAVADVLAPALLLLPLLPD